MRLIDTNAILRFLLADRDDERYQRVYLLFNRLEDGFEKVECKLLVFFQAIFVLKSFYKVNKATISEMMVKLLDYHAITPLTAKLCRPYGSEKG